jgi:hypothetical protein
MGSYELKGLPGRWDSIGPLPGTNARCSDVRYLVAIREKRTSRGHRVFVDAVVIRSRPLQEAGRYKKQAATRSGGALQRSLASRLRGSARLLLAALRPRTQSAGVNVLLRQKSICDNQSHHARENHQCREGFSDHWPRRMSRSQLTGLRFRSSLQPHDFALCRWCASFWFRRRAHASNFAVISAVDLANGQGRRLGLAHRLESGSIVSQKALCV